MVTLKLQCLQDLDGKPTNQASGNTLEIILLDKLVQVHTEYLEGEK